MGTKSAALILLVLPLLNGDDPAGRAADQKALRVYGGLVGEWKGTGQPQRGSARGAWVEKADWSWKLTKASAELLYQAPQGKYLREARLKPGKATDSFQLEATFADKSMKLFEGKTESRGVLVLTSAKVEDAGPSRVTLTPLHDTRFLLLLESKTETGAFSRIAEIGFTRQGVAFAAGDSSPVCIVTEGRGTIPVVHKGKTYYVCCSGCKDLFNENPEAVLAEAAERSRSKAK